MDTGSKSIIRIGGLEADTKAMREMVSRDPDDMSSRLNLAWTLFMLAISRAELDREMEPETLDEGPVVSDSLLFEALKQWAIVAKLGEATDTRAEIRRMRRLITLCGGGAALEQVEKLIVQSEEAVVRRVSS